MTLEIAILLGLLFTAMVMFAREVFPLEVTAFGVLVALVLTGIIEPRDALVGLSNPAVVTIGLLFILSHNLARTGILEVAAGKLSKMVGPRKWVGVAILLVAVSLSSAFLSNTAVVAIFIPLTINLAQRFKISPSKILLPLSYAAIVGGTMTLIGTSTNLIVNNIAMEHGLPALGMFEFTRLGWIFALLGLTYSLIFARRLLPSRAGVSSLTRKYHMGTYLTELKIPDESRLAGRSCKDIGVNRTYDITVLAIIRDKVRHIENIRNIALQAGDILIVRGEVDNIMRMRTELGVALLSDVKLSDSELSVEDQVLAEALVIQTSAFVGRSLRQIDFRRHYGVFVLAIRRHGATFREKIANIALRFADTLLILAPRERLREFRGGDDLVIISESRASLSRERLWWLSVSILPVMIVLVALGFVNILTAAMVAVLLLLGLRVLDVRDAYQSVHWSVLMLIAAFVPVGHAMHSTGAANLIAAGILNMSGYFPPEMASLAALSLLYLCTSLMTELVSNNATAIIVAPIALSLANSLGADPMPFIMAVAFAASAAFMTPVSYQTNMMVYGPGSYRFKDYLRFGVAMNLGLWVVASIMIPRLWPL